MINKNTSIVLLILFVFSLPQTKAIDDCVDAFYKKCLTFESFSKPLRPNNEKCLTSSVYGPIISKCVRRGKEYFSHAITIHGKPGATIKNICKGSVLPKEEYLDEIERKPIFQRGEHRTRKLLRPFDAKYFTTDNYIAVRHWLSEKCRFKGKDVQAFDIIYGHVDDGGKLSIDDDLNPGDTLGKLVECEDCYKAHKKKRSFLTLMVKVIYPSKLYFINPMTLFSDVSEVDEYFGIKARDEPSTGNIKVTLSTHCESTSINIVSIECGENSFHDENLTRDWVSFEKVNKNGQDKNKPYWAPKDNPFDIENEEWSIDYVIPASFRGKTNCCSVLMRDIWSTVHIDELVCYK